jgi:hypothetical protein
MGHPDNLRGMTSPRILWSVLALATVATASAQVLDKRALLEKQDFWINQDFDWYEKNIPFVDTPNAEINTTYYYRWELVTRHIVYGSPNYGYQFTEFANRPFWSGAYGTISCPAGMQIYDVRWLHDSRYVRDYLKFWVTHPGAQPRNYSFWLADSTWATHQVHPNPDFTTGMLPGLVKNYEGWKKKGWVEDMGMFWQHGHDDGMEFDINAQQTKDILRGGQSLRPSFNAYMWADAQAIAAVAKLKGDAAMEKEYSDAAAGIKSQVEKKLWDPKRKFFFPMSNQEHEKQFEGDPKTYKIEKHTLTYQSGKYAGSEHGRELHGYVPWAFNMPSAGFEEAWKFLMDEKYFKAPFGPTTVEQKDPMFVLKTGCCWWSGQSWPFATAQTLKGMANLLQNYEQKFVTRKDYAELLNTFSVSHRKDGKPYIAEALNPFTGSWEGHDMGNRSEHYFHSGFNDLVITGLAGIQPSADDNLVINPLIPDEWDFFAIDNVLYRGHKVAVIWDRTGERYKKGKGLQVLVDGKVAASSPKIGKLTVKLAPAPVTPYDEAPAMNFAVNNDGDYYPRYQASFVNPTSSLSAISDGQYVYDVRPSNRWTTVDSPNTEDSVEVDFGTKRAIDMVQLNVLDDGEGSKVRAPAKIALDYWDGAAWKPVPGQKASATPPVGRRPHTVSFPTLQAERLRATLTHASGAKSGLTEFQAWGKGVKPYVPASPPVGNIAFNASGKGLPMATATHSDQFGGKPEKAIDGKIIYEPIPMNRWTSFGSPNAVDSLEVELAGQSEIAKAILHIFDDRGGVQAPATYALEAWTGTEWKEIPGQKRNPEKATGGMANVVTFPKINTNKVRIVFTHKGNARSGLTEVELWKE